MVRNYLVYGIDSKGQKHLVKDTKSACEARGVRDAGNSPWVKSIVVGADGELSVAQLNALADKENAIA